MKTLRQLLRGLALAGATLVAACGGSGSDDASTPTPVTSSGQVEGRVVAADTGQALAGVKVTAASVSATSGGDGGYRLDGVAAADRIVVKAEAPGYLDGFGIVAVTASGSASATLRLQPAAPAQAVDATVATSVSMPGSPAQVQLPANGLVGPGGQPVTRAQVSVTPIDPGTDPSRMPGQYTAAAADGSVQRIESFGAIKVDLKGADGARLNLAPGATATIRIPLATRSASPPATVPLFYFDEQTGHWVQDGSATLVGSGPDAYYEGAVHHFTYWNADQVAQTVAIGGCVVDANGAPALQATVHTEGVDYSGSDTAQADAQGRFSLAARRGSKASVYAESDGRFSNVVQVQTANDPVRIGDCLVLPAGSVAPLMPPIIVVQPRDVETTAGLPVLLQATVIGSQPMRFVWKRNGVDVASSDSRMLLVPAPTAADDGAVYTLVASNAVGSATSDPATLHVSGTAPPPTLVAGPQSQTVAIGGSATFQVVAVSGLPLSYQWFRDGTPIPGATGTSYTLSPVATGDSGARFSVVVRHASGSVTSAAAELTVVTPTDTPSFVVQPADQAATPGADVNFTVNAIGTGTLRYQWQRNGVDVPDATAPTLVVEVAAADDGAQYRVVVRSATASVTSQVATLRVALGDPVAQARLTRLAELWSVAQQGTVAAFSLTDGEGRLLSPPCTSGSATVTLDGSAIGAGTLLPLGDHTLAAALDGCVSPSTAVLTGQSSVAYAFTDAAYRRGRYTATATGVRVLRMSGGTVESDDVVDGSGQAVVDGSTAGTLETSDARFAPTAGLTVASGVSGLTARFDGGTVQTHIVTRDARTPQQRVQTFQLRYDALTVVVDGVRYRLDGSYRFDFAADGLSLAASGVVTVTADGTPIGRLLGSSTGGLLADVRGTVPALGVRRDGPRTLRTGVGAGRR